MAGNPSLAHLFRECGERREIERVEHGTEWVAVQRDSQPVIHIIGARDLAALRYRMNEADISDRAAIALSRGLYGAVARRIPVDQAVTRARRDIKLSRPRTLEWATAVLYLRSPSTEIFDLTDPCAAPKSAR